MKKKKEELTKKPRPNKKKYGVFIKSNCKSCGFEQIAEFNTEEEAEKYKSKLQFTCKIQTYYP